MAPLRTKTGNLDLVCTSSNRLTVLGDKDNWISIKIPAHKAVHALAVHLNNEEDRGFITTKVSLKVGNQPKVLKLHSSKDLSTRHNGWLWFEVTGYSHIEVIKLLDIKIYRDICTINEK